MAALGEVREVDGSSLGGSGEGGRRGRFGGSSEGGRRRAAAVGEAREVDESSLGSGVKRER